MGRKHGPHKVVPNHRILELHAQGMKDGEIANFFGVDRTTITKRLGKLVQDGVTASKSGPVAQNPALPQLPQKLQTTEIIPNQDKKTDPLGEDEFDPQAIVIANAKKGNMSALKLYFSYFYQPVVRLEEKYFYIRPDWLFPHQEELLEMAKKGNMFVEGMRQLTGKTTLLHVCNLELQLEYPNWKTHCMTTSVDVAKELFIKKTWQDPKLKTVFAPWMKWCLSETYELQNGSISKIFPMKVTTSQGPTANVIWISEIDKLIMTPGGKEALAAIFPQLLRSMVENKGRIWIDCNTGTSRQFRSLKNVLGKLGGDFFPICEIVEPTGPGLRKVRILNKDVPSPDIAHMTLEQKEHFFKGFMYMLLKALAGEQFAKAMVYAVADLTEDPFRPELIDACFQERKVYALPTKFQKIVGFVDPGFYHATALLIVGFDGTKVYELHSQEYFGGEISEDAMKSDIAHHCIKLGVDELYVETNNGGIWWMNTWQQMGITCWAGGWSNENVETGQVTNTSWFERAIFERVLKDLIEKHLLVLFNDKIKTQWDNYDPLHNREKGKGDLMDCLLQAAFWVIGGIDYYENKVLDKLTEKNKAMVKNENV